MYDTYKRFICSLNSFKTFECIFNTKTIFYPIELITGCRKYNEKITLYIFTPCNKTVIPHRRSDFFKEKYELNLIFYKLFIGLCSFLCCFQRFLNYGVKLLNKVFKYVFKPVGDLYTRTIHMTHTPPIIYRSKMSSSVTFFLFFSHLCTIRVIEYFFWLL